jgi:DNA polymerase-1
MKIRTLLIDSSYLLKRSVNGVKDLFTNEFGYIGGLYSFIITTRKLITDYKINKVVLIWDGENGGIYRYRIDNNYKANRKNKSWFTKIELSEAQIKEESEKEMSILKQKKRIQEYAEELFLRQIEVDEIEGDDLIAQYCLDYNNKEEIFIFTNDRDFAQLLDLNITILFNNIDEPINKRNYYSFFGYTYKNALPLKIIEGDTSDNITGIKGIGEKTLFNNIPELRVRGMTVREICKKADEINEERVKNKKKPLKSLSNLIEGVERLKINYKLINLRNPMLNNEAIEEIEQLAMPLSPNGRSSKILLKMMTEDGFFKVYNGTFVNFVKPFYTVIMSEKSIYNKYLKTK